MAASRTRPTKRERELEAKLAAAQANEMTANRRALDAERALGARPQDDPPAWPSATERELILKRALDESEAKVKHLEGISERAQRSRDTNELIRFVRFINGMRAQPDSLFLSVVLLDGDATRTICVPVGDLRRWADLVRRRLIEKERQQ